MSQVCQGEVAATLSGVPNHGAWPVQPNLDIFFPEVRSMQMAFIPESHMTLIGYSGVKVHVKRYFFYKHAPHSAVGVAKTSRMKLTDKQAAEKKAVAAQLLTIKENSYNNLMAMQTADMQEAEATNDDTQNMFEDGKVDQSINRVEARASVVEALQHDINVLSNIDDIDPTEEIQLGDIIKTNRGTFFVGAASDEFEVSGQKYRGISVDSPLFLALKGKQNGDTVEVNGTTFTLEDSY
jgi:transcription elongation GreA/GreB family factor